MINMDLHSLGLRLHRMLGAPRIGGLHLPTPADDETCRDAFAFVFLDDGSVGPFYVSLDDMLRRLWQRFPQPYGVDEDCRDWLAGFDARDLVARGLAVGTYNALSAALFRNVGYPRCDARGAHQAPAVGRIGMVGYFAPLIERLTDNGSEVYVLEKAPQRIAAKQHVHRVDDAHALRDCQRVICTASTLVNDSLSGLLLALDGQVPVELIGPSASGVPDPLFAHGIHGVGGVLFEHRDDLLAKLGAGLPWGRAGRKYQLSADKYPGVDALARDFA